MEVFFFLKKTVKNKTSIHSISRTKTSCKYVFPQSVRDPEKHMESVKTKVLATEFKCAVHLAYRLKGKEIRFYVNLANGEYWFNKIPLVKTPTIEKQASDDILSSDYESEDDEPMVIRESSNFNKSSYQGIDLEQKISKRVKFSEPIAANKSRSCSSETVSATNSRSCTRTDEMLIIADQRSKQKAKSRQTLDYDLEQNCTSEEEPTVIPENSSWMQFSPSEHSAGNPIRTVKSIPNSNWCKIEQVLPFEHSKSQQTRNESSWTNEQSTSKRILTRQTATQSKHLISSKKITFSIYFIKINSFFLLFACR